MRMASLLPPQDGKTPNASTGNHLQNRNVSPCQGVGGQDYVPLDGSATCPHIVIVPQPLFAFAHTLRTLLAARTLQDLERQWALLDVPGLGERALRPGAGGAEPVLDEVDGLLLRLIDRLPGLPGPAPLVERLRAIRLPVLERLQHRSAAELVAARYGTAGLHAVLASQEAPRGRRYFAFLALAARHPANAWPLFQRYLTPDAHHAFVGAAAEAARFYPERRASQQLVDLFNDVRSDLHLRQFLSPRILESLYVLDDPATLSFFRSLLLTGHTDAEQALCEVTRALVMVRRFTGLVEPNVKWRSVTDPDVWAALDDAEASYDAERDALTPVTVI